VIKNTHILFKERSSPTTMAIKTSKKELIDLLIAWIVISIAFGIIIIRGSEITLNNAIISILIAALTVGIGFIVHELAHKIAAQIFHCKAEFRKDSRMLVFAVLMSFVGFIFAAPGGVRFSGHVTKKQYGIIAMVGPLANFIIAALFLLLVFLPPVIRTYGFMINAWLGLFNLIPFPGFDGRKVLDWSKISFALMVVIGIIINIPFFL
jgi:Zn-dependent protease